MNVLWYFFCCLFLMPLCLSGEDSLSLRRQRKRGKKADRCVGLGLLGF
jgi:hypothetical protein